MTQPCMSSQLCSFGMIPLHYLKIHTVLFSSGSEPNRLNPPGYRMPTCNLAGAALHARPHFHKWVTRLLHFALWNYFLFASEQVCAVAGRGISSALLSVCDHRGKTRWRLFLLVTLEGIPDIPAEPRFLTFVLVWSTCFVTVKLASEATCNFHSYSEWRK